MPVVLQSDVDDFKQAQINSLDSILGNPFSVSSTPGGDTDLTRPTLKPPESIPSAAVEPAPVSTTGDVAPAASAPVPDTSTPTPTSGHDASTPRTSQFALGLSATDAAAFCGPAAAMALAQHFGNNIPVQAAKDAAVQSGWDAQNGMHGIVAEQKLLDSMKVPTTIESTVSWDHVRSDVTNGNPVVISTPGHYFIVDGIGDNGTFHVGTSGTDLRGGSEFMTPDQMQNRMGQANGALYVQNPQQTGSSSSVPTTAGLSGGGKSDSSDPHGIVSAAYQTASWLGDQGQKALHAVLQTEGGMNGARGDNGKSAGPLQFYEGGQLANFAQQMGMSLDAAKNYIEQNPNAAVQWAIGTPDKPGYLGAAILAGEQAGLKGADLATYAQQHGQVSVSPERAGQNYNLLYGNGGTFQPDTTPSTPTQPSNGTISPSPTSPQDNIAAFDQANPNPFDQARNAVSGALDQAGQTKDAAIAALDQHLGNPFDAIANSQFAKNVTGTNPNQAQLDQNLQDSGVQLPTSPGAALSSNLGEPTEGVGAAEDRNAVIAGANPLKDVPVVGGATTFAAQTALDPTNLLLLGGNPEAVGNAAGTIGGKAIDAGANLLDKVSPPQIAYASTSGQDAAALANHPALAGFDLSAYPPEVQGALNSLVSTIKDPDLVRSMVADFVKNTPPTATFTNTATKDVVGAVGVKPNEMVTPPKAPTVAPPETPSPSPAPVEDLPPARYDPESGKWVDQHGKVLPDTAPLDTSKLGDNYGNSGDKVIVRDGTGYNDVAHIESGHTTLSGAAAHTEIPDPNAPLPSKIISQNGTGPTPPPVEPDMLPRRITPDMVQMAREQINKSAGDQAAEQDQLTQLLQQGADPGELARFMMQVRGESVGPTDVLRGFRTGSMAGGPGTEVQVALNPIIQVAMRAPVAAVKAIVRGHPSDVPNGMLGGLQGLSEGAYDGLQTIRYGVNDRSALTGTAGGGYGFKPGLDVAGSNKFQRAVGTAGLGLVRTHGALSDVAAGIGRGAATATGATPEAATELGQQMALRSGNYGTIGKTFADALDGVKKVNPALDVTGQILVPFYRVMYNKVTQAVERSPAGIVGTAADIVRGKLPASAPAWLKGPYATGADASHVTPVGDRLANNAFGLGLAGLGFAQAASGNITGEHPQNGEPKWSVQVGGHWMPLRMLGVPGEALAQSAILYESARDGDGNVGRMAELSAAAYAGHLYDETWLRSIGDVITSIGDAKDIGTPREGAAISDLQFKLGSEGKSFLPQANLIGQTASALSGDQSGSGSSTPASRPTRPTRPVQPKRPTRPTR